jgi:hypothetical protein
MTAKIKLNAASGGGSFSLQAPSSSANTRVMTLPDTADGTILTTTNPKSGNIIQVVATNLIYDSSVSIPNGSLADTPHTVTITSTAANSKFLISASISGEASIPDHNTAFVLRRVIGGTATSINVGNNGGSSRPAVTFMSNQGYYDNNNTSTAMTTVMSPYLDSPGQAASTAITYKISLIGMDTTGTFYFGRTASDANNNQNERLSNWITVMEVAA